jgi:heme-degrading monooxygenase HmoA
MKRQPGYISAQLHRGIGASRVFLNYAIWESVADFKLAFHNPAFTGDHTRVPGGGSGIASPVCKRSQFQESAWIESAAYRVGEDSIPLLV